MRSGLVIEPPPGLNFCPGVMQAHEPVFVQTFLTQPAVEAFDHGVVGGLARPAEVQLDAAFIGPFVHHLADELAAIV